MIKIHQNSKIDFIFTRLVAGGHCFRGDDVRALHLERGDGGDVLRLLLLLAVHPLALALLVRDRLAQLVQHGVQQPQQTRAEGELQCRHGLRAVLAQQ
eukprot:1186724-Prorocentrum_minimum.AAC.3